jgi:hypothetical protein
MLGGRGVRCDKHPFGDGKLLMQCPSQNPGLGASESDDEKPCLDPVLCDPNQKVKTQEVSPYPRGLLLTAASQGAGGGCRKGVEEEAELESTGRRTRTPSLLSHKARAGAEHRGLGPSSWLPTSEVAMQGQKLFGGREMQTRYGGPCHHRPGPRTQHAKHQPPFDFWDVK